MKIKGSRVLESTLTKSQQPNLMLITHILRFSNANLRYVLLLLQKLFKSFNESILPQITKDI
jgi:hypothetical protein